MKTKIHIHLGLLAVLACLSTLNPQLSAAPVGSAFTYQGQLTDGGQPARGAYDLQFTLYDSPAGSIVAGGPITTRAVGVSNGLFTVTLDFGGGVFTGDARWLQIGVRTNGSSDDFTTLGPRQPLTPSPYAITASNLSGTLPASQLTGTLPSANLSGAYSGAVTFNNAANSFTGNGAGLTALNASQLTTGTVPDARLSTNVALLNAAQTFSAAKAFTGTVTFSNAVQTYASAGIRLNDRDLYFRPGADPLHGLGWYGDPKYFGGVNVNGPVLYGNGGGALGAMGGVTNIALQWDSSRNVTVAGTLNASGPVQFAANSFLNNKDLYLRNDPFHGLGWYGAGKLFAGQNVNGPALYGNGGGVLGSVGGVTNIALQWDASGAVQFGTNAFLKDKDLLLRADRNHGLGWYGFGKPFASATPDGPVVYGYSGGALGVLQSGVTTNVALQWDSSGNVGIGTATPGAKLQVNGTVTANGLIRASGGLVIENRTSDPPSPATGQIWLRTDL